MAYHGYIDIITHHLSKFDAPSVLEIGLDRGVMTVPLVTRAAIACKQYLYLGIDVKVQESLLLTLQMMPDPIPQSVKIIEDNSLNVLPQFIKSNLKFDLILLDGDHNYYTVSKELLYIEHLLSDPGLLLIDDVSGRWSDRDLFYSTREGYETNGKTTPVFDTDKKGVGVAVNEWLEKVGWHSAKPLDGEPLLVSRLPFQ